MFTQEDFDKLSDLIKKHEGVYSKVYKDTKGIETIGVGRNLRDVGLRDIEIEFLLANDLAEVIQFLVKNYDWFNELSDLRQSALIDLCFCVGKKGYSKFKNMNAALKNKDFELAAKEILDSLFAKQTGIRAKELAQMLSTDKWPEFPKIILPR